MSAAKLASSSVTTAAITTRANAVWAQSLVTKAVDTGHSFGTAGRETQRLPPRGGFESHAEQKTRVRIARETRHGTGISTHASHTEHNSLLALTQ